MTTTRLRQKVLILYLQNSALDSKVIGWAQHDGTGQTQPGPGEQDAPPYETGVQALRDGWRLIQASQLTAAASGNEFQTDYLKYEFFFEQLVDTATS
jgi:hypothetical protein